MAQLKLDEGIYEGDVKNGLPHGYGKLTYTDDEVTKYYEGEWKNGERHGTGKLVFVDDEYVEGVWEEDGFVYGKWQDKYGYYVGAIQLGERDGYGEEHLNTGRSWKGMWKEGKKVPHEKSDPIPNAVRIWPLGNVDLVRIEDFSCEAGLGKPLNCEHIDVISTAEMKELSKILEFTVVGYIDSYANQKKLVNNYVMCDLSGYEYLPGTCIVCGWKDGDVAPLTCEQAETFFDLLVESLQEDE